MKYKLGDKVYFTDQGQVLESEIIHIISPTKDMLKNGAKILYELDNGHATPQVYKTRSAASKAL